MFKQMINDFVAQRQQEQLGKAYRDLIHREAKMGGQLFGKVPAGRRREFFCLDEHTWVWHEEWTDENNQRQIITTRYNIRPNGILKSQNNQSYQPVSQEEARRLLLASNDYLNRAKKEIYHTS